MHSTIRSSNSISIRKHSRWLGNEGDSRNQNLYVAAQRTGALFRSGGAACSTFLMSSQQAPHSSAQQLRPDPEWHQFPFPQNKPLHIARTPRPELRPASGGNPYGQHGAESWRVSSHLGSEYISFFHPLSEIS